MITRKRLPAEKRKRVIIRAAIEVFSESNYRVAKISDIAIRAGVTDPIIYKFFESKSELFQEILKITSKKTITNTLAQELFFHPERIRNKKELRTAIEKSIWSYFSSMEKYRKELKIYFQAISEVDDPAVNEVIRESYQNYVLLYQDVLQKGVDESTLKLLMSAQTIAWDIIGFTIHQSTLFVMGFYKEEDARILLAERVKVWIP